MCLLVFMDKNATAPEKSLRNAAENNPDGFGWAIHTGNKIMTHKGMDFDAVYDQFIEARKQYTGYALFHLRITTHGDTIQDNCHPFYIGSDRKSVLAHNGMLPIEPAKGDVRSDTRILAEDLLPASGGIAYLNSDKQIAEMEKWAQGSKLVLLSVNPASKWQYLILNHQLGHWGEATSNDEGVWWSNNSYKNTWRSFSTYSSSMWNDNRWDYSIVSKPSTTEKSRDEELDDMFIQHAAELASLHTDSPKDVRELADHMRDRWWGYCDHEGFGEYYALCYYCDAKHHLTDGDIPPTHCSYCNACLWCGEASLHDDTDCCGWKVASLVYNWQDVASSETYDEMESSWYSPPQMELDFGHGQTQE